MPHFFELLSLTSGAYFNRVITVKFLGIEHIFMLIVRHVCMFE